MKNREWETTFEPLIEDKFHVGHEIDENRQRQVKRVICYLAGRHQLRSLTH